MPGHRPRSRAPAEADPDLPSDYPQHSKLRRDSKPLYPKTPRRRKGHSSRVLRNGEECVRAAFHRGTDVLKGTEACVWRTTYRSMSPEH